MATHSLTLTVEFRITDNEARSALEALRVKMGMGDRVKDLVREELWEIAVEADTEDAALETVGGLVRTTNLFANPNKHRYTLAAAAADGHRLALNEVAILVTDRGGTGGASVMSAIQRIGVKNVVGVRKWTCWRVRLSGPAESWDPELLSLIERIGVATGRRDGLLSNPHSQISRVVLPWGEEKVLAA